MNSKIKYVAFGDSLSTPGASGPGNKVWTEHLATLMGTIPHIHAHGGATSSHLAAQTAQYKATASNNNEKVIYSLGTGGNDFLGAAIPLIVSFGVNLATIGAYALSKMPLVNYITLTKFIPFKPLFALEWVVTAGAILYPIGKNVHNTYNAVHELNAINDGSEKQFVIMSVPPLHEFQAVKSFNPGSKLVDGVLTPAYVAAKHAINAPNSIDYGAAMTGCGIKETVDFVVPVALKGVSMVNSLAASSLTMYVNYQGISTLHVDSVSFYNQLQPHLVRYGLNNDPGCVVVKGCAQGVFYDDIHPATKYHELFAHYVYGHLDPTKTQVLAQIPEDIALIKSKADALKSWNKSSVYFHYQHCERHLPIMNGLDNQEKLISILSIDGSVDKFKNLIEHTVRKYHQEHLVNKMQSFEQVVTSLISSPSCGAYDKYIAISGEVISFIEAL